MAHTCQFVDSIASSPNVRLDLNDGVTWKLLTDGTEFPPPPLRRAVAQTLLTDGGIVPSSAYDNRVLRMRLALLGSTADTGATQTQTLARELNRPANIVKWQPATTAPVFFRTFRSDVSSIQELHGRDGKRFFDVEILAEPFAYGLREDPQTAATVNNDPAAGSNGLFFDVGTIKGDVETPAKIHTPVTATTVSRRAVIGVRRRGTPSNVTLALQAESMTVGTDTTSSADATASNGNRLVCTFATATTMTQRASGLWPSGTGVDKRGVYRVFVRVQKTVATDSIAGRIIWGSNTQAVGRVTNATVSFGTGLAGWVLYDLGTIAVPVGGDPVTEGFSGSEMAVDPAAMAIRFEAQRSLGTGSLRIDYFAFIPADAGMMIVDLTDQDITGNFIYDPASDMWYVATGTANSPQNANTRGVSWVGGAIMLQPNQTNRLYWLGDVRDDLDADLITDTTTVGISYWPRYLQIRPAST